MNYSNFNFIIIIIIEIVILQIF